MTPPRWLDPAAEIPAPSQPRDLRAFVARHLAVLLALGVPRLSAFDLIAHAAIECAWGVRAIGHNAGGCKARRDDAAAHLRDHGVPMPWWRWAGHTTQGDAPEVYYRGFADDVAFWAFWLARYVPRESAPTYRYHSTGLAFWRNPGSEWFVEMLLAGYRGPVTEASLRETLLTTGAPGTHPSIATHRSVAARVQALAS